MHAIDGYRANRLLLLLLLALLLPAVLVWDLQGIQPTALTALMAQRAEAMDLGWASDFLARVTDDWLKIGMLIALAVFSLYGLLQWIGAKRDRTCLARYWKQPRAIALCGKRSFGAFLTGRPLRLYETLPKHQVLELHFGYGRTHLLEPLRLALWAFPVVGFIGTILGVSQAVKYLPTAMQDQAMLGAVLGSLHLAFDTTFLGLMSSVFIMIQVYLIDAMWNGNLALANELSEFGEESATRDNALSEDAEAPSLSATNNASAWDKTGHQGPTIGNIDALDP